MHFQPGAGKGMGEAFVAKHLRARGHGPDRHATVLDPLPHARDGGLRHDLGRVLAEVEPHRVGVMHGDVGDHPATRRGVIDAPALQEGRQKHRVMDAHRQDLADAATGDQGANGAVAARAAQVMVGGEGHTLGLGRLHHGDRIGHAHRQRLFADDMLAGGDGRHGLREVLFIGRGDIDRLNAGIAQRRGEVRGRPPAMLGGEVGAQLSGPADHPGDIPAIGLDRAHHVLRRNRAGTNENPPHL